MGIVSAIGIIAIAFSMYSGAAAFAHDDHKGVAAAFVMGGGGIATLGGYAILGLPLVLLGAAAGMIEMSWLGEPGSGLSMAVGGGLIVISLPLLIFGGLGVDQFLVELFKGQATRSTGAFGAALGILGGGLLYGGVNLCDDGSTPPITPGKIAVFGILWPGSAQVYGGRNSLAVGFLMGPFFISTLGGAAVLIGKALSLLSPTLAKPFLFIGAIGVASGLFAPISMILALVASVAEGVWWASRLENGVPEEDAPRFRGSLLGFGAFVFGFFMLWAAYMMPLHVVSSISDSTTKAAPPAGSNPKQEEPAFTQDPEKAAQYDRAARTAYKTDLDLARRHWRNAVAYDEANPKYRYNHATALWMLGEKSAAAKEYAVFLKLAPDGKRAPQVREKLRAYREGR